MAKRTFSEEEVFGPSDSGVPSGKRTYSDADVFGETSSPLAESMPMPNVKRETSGPSFLARMGQDIAAQDIPATGPLPLPKNERPDPNKPRDSFLTAAGKSIMGWPAQGRQIVGSIIQAAEDNPFPLEVGSTPQVRENLETEAALRRRIQGPGIGQQIVKSATKDIADNYTANVEPFSGAGVVSSVIQSAPLMVAAALTTFATKSPMAGAAVMGAGAGAQEYGALRGQGFDPGTAGIGGFVTALSEAGGENIPLGMLIKPGGRFLTNTAKVALSEDIQEQFTEAFQIAYDKAVVTPDMPISEAYSRMVQAGIVGAAMGGGLSVATAPFKDRPYSDDPSGRARALADVLEGKFDESRMPLMGTGKPAPQPRVEPTVTIPPPAVMAATSVDEAIAAATEALAAAPIPGVQDIIDSQPSPAGEALAREFPKVNQPPSEPPILATPSAEYVPTKADLDTVSGLAHEEQVMDIESEVDRGMRPPPAAPVITPSVQPPDGEPGVVTPALQPEPERPAITADQARKALLTNRDPVTGRKVPKERLDNFRSMMRLIVRQEKGPLEQTKLASTEGGPDPDMSVLANIKRMGGIRTRDENGQLTREGQEIMALLKDVKRPGLINNVSGRTPDKLRESFREAGYWGGREDMGADLQDFYDLIAKEAGGEQQFHPESTKAREIEAKRIEEDNDARRLEFLQAKAEKLGIAYQPDWTADEIAAEVTEREAMQAETADDLDNIADEAQSEIAKEIERLRPLYDDPLERSAIADANVAARSARATEDAGGISGEEKPATGGQEAIGSPDPAAEGGRTDLPQSGREQEPEAVAPELPEGYSYVEGRGQLGRGKWGVQGPDGNLVFNLHATKEEAAKTAKQRIAAVEANANERARSDAKDKEIAARIRAGGEITDADLKHLNLKSDSAGFPYLSPVVQRLFGISKAKVREAMGDALRATYSDMGAEYFVANPRKALANAARYGKAPTVEPGAEGLPQTVIPGTERSEAQAKRAGDTRAQAELRARQQQSKMRRGGQLSAGGMFAPERDQTDLLTSKSTPAAQPTPPLTETRPPLPETDPATGKKPGSWFVVDKEGRAVREIFSAEAAAKVNREKYDVLPAGEYLGGTKKRALEREWSRAIADAKEDGRPWQDVVAERAEELRPLVREALSGQSPNDRTGRAYVEGIQKAIDEAVSRKPAAQPEPKKAEVSQQESQNRKVLSTGAILKSKSGRELSPVPKVDATGNRKTINTLARIDEWLLREATAEVTKPSTGSVTRDAQQNYQATLLKGLDAKRLSPADRDMINEILFGDPDGATEANLVAPKSQEKPVSREVKDAIKAVRPGLRDMAQRIVNAENNFDEMLMESGGLTAQEAATVRAFMLKQKIAALDSAIGRISVKHGGFLEKDAIRRALDAATQKNPAAPVSISSPSKDAEKINTPTGAYTLAEHAEVAKRIREGDFTGDEARAGFERAVASKTAIVAELMKMTKADLVKNFTGLRYKNDPKETIVKAAFSSVLEDFNPSGGYSYTMGEKPEDGLRRKLATVKDGDFKAAADARKERAAALVKRYTNPETISEYEDFIRVRGRDKLTSEQLAKYDELKAEAGRAQQAAEAERKNTIRKVDTPADMSEIIETKHTQKGHALFVVKLSDRVPKEVYTELSSAAKRLGGYYSSFRGNGAIPGFQFKTREAAEKFRALREGNVSKADMAAERAEEVKDNAVDRLRDMAAKMTEEADESLSRDRKDNTARRARMAASAEAQAAADKALAETMRNIADAIESGAARNLDSIRTRVDVEMMDSLLRRTKHIWAQKQIAADKSLRYEKLMEQPVTAEMVAEADYPYPYAHVETAIRLATALASTPGSKLASQRVLKAAQAIQARGGWRFIAESLGAQDDLHTLATNGRYNQSVKYESETILESFRDYKRLTNKGWRDLPSLRAALREFLQYRGTKVKADPLKAAERALVGAKYEGYFPTPKELARRVVDEADIRDGMDVLEPSAGKGDIADAARDAAPEANITVIEPVGALRNILEMKGHTITGTDFLEHEGEFDRIVMNPPFEDRQDVAHVQHAYSLLKPGGRVVAIMSEGPFFGSDKRATEFRDWLEEVGGTSEKLPEGSFSQGDRPTNVNARLVVIDKPKGGGMFSRRAPETTTPEFEKWFGKSKVVDASGKPLVVYHGSPDMRFMKGDATFKSSKEKFGLGSDLGVHWFTENPSVARTYANEHRAFDYQNAEGGVVAAYLKMENPLIIDAKGAKWREAQARGKTRDVIDQAREGGHDGVIIRNVKDDYNNDAGTRTTDTYAVFDSRQIKSTNNRGTFDPDNPNVMFSRREKRADGKPVMNFRTIPGGVVVELAPEMEAKREAFKKALLPRLAKILPKDVALRIVDRFDSLADGTPVHADGYMLKQIMIIALDSKDGVYALNHEAIHALRNFGVIDDKEWDILVKEARATWRAYHKIDELYPEVSDAQRDEEAVAFAFAKWAKDKQSRLSEMSAVRRIFQRMLDALSAIRESLFGVGIDTTDKIFARIDRGTVGRRARTRDPSEPRTADSGGAFAAAWHGTPHDFDEFSTTKIGTGEGAQSYGWGLYFAGEKSVAEHYRAGLAGKPKGLTAKLDGKEDWWQAAPPDREGMGELWGRISPYNIKTKDDVERILARAHKDLRQTVKNIETGSVNVPTADASGYREALRLLDEGRVTFDPPHTPGRLFQVDLKPKDDEWLDLDKPLGEQSDKVKAALAPIRDRLEEAEQLEEYEDRKNAEFDEWTGQELVRQIIPRMITDDIVPPGEPGSPLWNALEEGDTKKPTSLYLKSLGIPGSRYLDGASRKDGEGTFNYVVFDEGDVHVLGKFAKRAQTETPEFKAWFGDSKIVDEDGAPLVVYHGTGSDIDTFRPQGGGQAEGEKALRLFREARAKNEPFGYMNFRSGTFFSPDPDYAGRYTGESGGAMYPVYIKAESPIYMDQKTGKVKGPDPYRTPDALILHEDGKINEIAVIDPTQIKSATGNRGTFDPENPDIMFAKRPPKEPPRTPVGELPPGEEPLPKYAGNINLNRLKTTDDVKRAILEVSREKAAELDTARRGTISHDETKALAAMIDPSDLMARKIGDAFNAEQAMRLRQFLVHSAESLFGLARKARGGSDQDIIAFQEALVRHVAIQEQVAGMTAEAGRALSSFNILAEAADMTKAIKRAIEAAGGRDQVEAIATMLGDLDSPDAVSRFARKVYKPTGWDMVLEAWINGLLSGPQTHAVNAASNMLTAIMTVPETAIAAGLGLARGGSNRVIPREVAARLFGLFQGGADGARAAAKAFITEEPSGLMGKTDTRKHRAIPGTAGRAIRIPGRALLASDEFFKSIGYRQELNALAARQAMGEGLKGKALATRITELVANPTAAMMEKARDTAEHQTFTDPSGPIAQKILALTNRYPAMKLVVPFVRTPANIIKYAAERTPAAYLFENMRDDLTGKNGPVAQDTARARVLFGSSIMAAVAALAIQGLLTGGGPDDQRKRNMLYATGWQPYSVKIGDTYYSYARLEPIATLMGTMADAVEISNRIGKDDAGNLAATITGAAMRDITNKTFLRGLSDVMNAVQDPERYGEAWVEGLTGTVVPTGIAQYTRVDDPFLREANGIIDKIKSRLPGYSKTLKAKRDIFGEPIKREGGVGPDIISPIFTTADKNDRVANELIRLDMALPATRNTILGVELNADEKDALAAATGRLIKRGLTRFMGSAAYERLPDDLKRDEATKIINATRAAARSLVTARYPRILRERANQQVERAQQLQQSAP